MTQAAAAAALTTFPPANSISRVVTTLAASKPNNPCILPCRPRLNVPKASLHDTSDASVSLAPAVSRRNVIALGISGGVILFGLNASEEGALAAARRPPPTPPGEKKDPNVNGVLAKVIASKKRKEAMKEEMAKQRERGKKVVE